MPKPEPTLREAISRMNWNPVQSERISKLFKLAEKWRYLSEGRIPFMDGCAADLDSILGKAED